MLRPWRVQILALFSLFLFNYFDFSAKVRILVLFHVKRFDLFFREYFVNKGMLSFIFDLFDAPVSTRDLVFLGLILFYFIFFGYLYSMKLTPHRHRHACSHTHAQTPLLLFSLFYLPSFF